MFQVQSSNNQFHAGSYQYQLPPSYSSAERRRAHQSSMHSGDVPNVSAGFYSEMATVERDGSLSKRGGNMKQDMQYTELGELRMWELKLYGAFKSLTHSAPFSFFCHVLPSNISLSVVQERIEPLKSGADARPQGFALLPTQWQWPPLVLFIKSILA